MNGWQFLEEFEKIKAGLAKEIAIYMVSSSTSYYDIQKAGCIEDIKKYFVKPFLLQNFLGIAQNNAA